jgi:hypothetical protein
MDADEPTSVTFLTVFDREGGTHEGILRAASDCGSIISIDGHIVAFDPEGWSHDGRYCLCPESLPAPRCAEVLS